MTTDATRAKLRKAGKTRMKRLKEELAAQGKTLSDYQREIRAKVSHASNVRNGKAGFVAACKAGFPHKALEAARQYRLAHPTVPERAVIAILDSLNVKYEREYYALNGTEYPVDFWLVEYSAIVEVNGRVHYDEFFDKDGTRAERESKRLDTLRAFGYPVLVLDSSVGSDGMRKEVVEFLETLAKGATNA